MEKKYNEYWDMSNLCEREIIRICHEYEMKHNISDTAFWILYTIHGSEERMTQTDICSSLYAPRQSTNTALIKLEEDGIIEKIPVPDNKKSKYVVLTERGKAFAGSIVLPMKQAEQKTLAAFTDEEIEIYLNVMKKRCELFRTLTDAE